MNRRDFLSALGGASLLAAPNGIPPISISSGGYVFEWDYKRDEASVRLDRGKQPFWRGGLLPAMLVETRDKKQMYVKAVVESNGGAKLALMFSSFATGVLEFKTSSAGFEISALTISWRGEPLPIIAMYFGTAPLSIEERTASPVVDQSFWPNWEAAGFAVPGAKGAPLQSVFRRWDFGEAVLPLGSFGPSLGTPYAAAFPRPVYAAALGDDNGWLCAGTGAISDGALCLVVQSSSACLRVLYREDLWRAPKGKQRIWNSPLRLTWARDPWHAYENYFGSFHSNQTRPALPLKPQWNSWGDFRKNIFQLRELADWTKRTDAEILGIDDRWESFVGSGEPNFQRFPAFDDDIRYIQSQGMQVGFWQAIGWVDEPEKVGLSSQDLIVGPDGTPRRSSWDTNPRNRSHYCLDPSSPKTVDFLRRRTIRLMERYRPTLLKLDFGYGMPSPNTGVPRDPRLRGERLSFRLVEIIAGAARSVNPDVAIEYYSLHPLWRDLVNVVALDDLGDGGRDEAAGHGQWSIWAALAGQGSTIMASSGYDWNQDADVVLNSAILGVPGAVLSRTMEDGSPIPAEYLDRRIALNRWYRRTSNWKPLWLNSSPGGYMRDPYIRCFGRLEPIGGGDRLTAVVLRDQEKELVPTGALKTLEWSGNWVLIAQDDADIFHSRRLACLPVQGWTLNLPRRKRPDRVLFVTRSGEAVWTQWQWTDGRLLLEAPKTSDRFLGFLIEDGARGA